MSTQDEQTDIPVNNAGNDQLNEVVDYADPKSPTLAIRRLNSPTTGQTDRQPKVHRIELADIVDAVLPGMVASPVEEAHNLSTKSATSKRDSDILNDEGMVDSISHHPMKLRRLDLGDLMVKTTGPAKPISDRPVEHFRTVRRPEITRLTESDPMPPPPVNNSLGRGSGKDGRPLVSDLVQARAKEVALRKQLEEERQKHDAFR